MGLCLPDTAALSHVLSLEQFSGSPYRQIKYSTSLWTVVLAETLQARKTNLYPEYLFLSVKMNLYPFKGGNGPV